MTMNRFLTGFFFSLFCLLSFPLFAQVQGDRDIVIKGQVAYDAEDVYYDVIVSCDSVVVFGDSYASKDFEMRFRAKDVSRVDITSVLFESVCIPIDSKHDTIDLGLISVRANELGEAAIVAYKRTYEREKGRLIVNVEDNYLQTYGTAVTVLGRVPGVRIDKAGGISLIDGSKVTIFLNGRKLTNLAVLNTLSSKDLETVTVDRNPSARYNAETQAGIFINTKRRENNHLSVDIGNAFVIGRSFSDQINMTISHKAGGLSNYLSLLPSIDNGVQYDVSSETLFNASGSPVLESKKSLENRTKNKFLTAFYALSWSPSEKTEMGFQYSGDITKVYNKNLINQVIDEVPEDYEKDLNENEGMHNFSLNYAKHFNNDVSLSLLADYALFRTSSKENMTTTSPMISNSRDDFRILGFQSEAHFENPVSIDVGASFNLVSNSGMNEYNDIRKIVDVKESIYALYASLEGEVWGFDISAGVRGELSRMKVMDDSRSKVSVDTSYFRLFPSFNISRAFGDDAHISFSFGQSIKRPSFEQLNPSLSLYDKISYTEGNPSLRPSVRTTFKLSGAFRGLSASVSYKRIKDVFIDLPIWQPNETMGTSIKWTTRNFDIARELSAEIDYAFSFNKFSGMIVANYNQPFFAVEVLGVKQKMNRPMLSFDAVAEYEISKCLSLAMEYEFTGPHDNYMFKNDKPSHSLNLQLSGVSKNNRLRYGIGVEDLFKTQRWNTWTLSYSNSRSTMDSNLDSRLIYISLSYHFGGPLHESERKAANQKNIDRL